MKQAYGDMGVNLSITLLSTFYLHYYSYLHMQYIDTINIILHLTTVVQIDGHQPQCKNDIDVQDSAAP